jgi:drug/metabolite transporter (DMT)-like permease
VLFAAMGVIWGIPYLLIKVADGGVSVPVLAFTRVAVALGVLVLGEHLTAAIGVSFAAILGGSVLATRPGSRRARTAPPPAEAAAPVAGDGVTTSRSE